MSSTIAIKHSLPLAKDFTASSSLPHLTNPSQSEAAEVASLISRLA